MKFQGKIIFLIALALVFGGVRIGRADDDCHGTFHVLMINVDGHRLSSTLTVEYRPERDFPSPADGSVTFQDKTSITLQLKGVADGDLRGDESITLNSGGNGGGDRGPGLYAANVSMSVKDTVNPGPPQYVARGTLQVRIVNMNYEGLVEGPVSCPERKRRPPFGPIIPPFGGRN